MAIQDLETMELAIQKKGIFDLIIPLLSLPNQSPTILTLLLQTLDAIFHREKASMKDAFLTLFQDKGGIDVVEALQNSENDKVYEYSSMIIQKYCNGQEV